MTYGPGTKKLAGSGRVLFWNGGSLWVGHAEDPTEPHAHYAIQLSFVLSEGVMSFRHKNEELNGLRCAVICSNYVHSFAAKGQLVAQIFIDPESREGLALRSLFKSGVSVFDEQLVALSISELTKAYLDCHSDQHLIAAAMAVVRQLADTNKRQVVELDTRIIKSIGIIKSHLAGSVLLSDVAANVNLSPDRFRHLFIEQTGIRFRQYILWLRLCTAVFSYSHGSSLTDAALTGGFADAAHFTRTFKRMFGIAPIRLKITKIKP